MFRFLGKQVCEVPRGPQTLSAPHFPSPLYTLPLEIPLLMANWPTILASSPHPPSLGKAGFSMDTCPIVQSAAGTLLVPQPSIQPWAGASWAALNNRHSLSRPEPAVQVPLLRASSHLQLWWLLAFLVPLGLWRHHSSLSPRHMAPPVFLLSVSLPLLRGHKSYWTEGQPCSCVSAS